ncbi:flagellar motor switch protein FliN [Haliea sp. SAOS-164]|uniref:flagellar motor switch protein FliN n=1 Tax=Mangrovimicrobium sediminis TaxID=2562682 RepID=UPI001F0E6524|nr:flagellar motor switch protein FliN [Haliea sp. SAOS-164]
MFADAAGDSADAGAADGEAAAADDADEEDPWAAALAEQQAAEAGAEAQEPEPEPPPAVREGSSDVFQPLGQSAANTSSRELDIIMDIPVKLNVELGRTKISIRQLLELAQGSVLELDGLAGDPMDILINGYLIAQGEVVVVEDKYGIRITDIITPSERVKKLNR